MTILYAPGIAALGIILTFWLARPTRMRIVELLNMHDIDYRFWGGDHHSKTVDDLVEFVQNGEIWIERKNGSLINHVNVAVGTVTCRHNGHMLELREYRNGAPRSFTGSLGEKIKFGETPQEALQRGLFEELGATEPSFKDHLSYEIDSVGTETIGPQASDFFPGMLDTYHRHLFVCDIPTRMYHNRYVAHDNGKMICFAWVSPEKR